MEPLLWPTLADAAQVLEARGIRFAVIGGLAVSLRGLPRMTVDVDLVVLAGRPQDEQDIRGLIAANGDAIDWPGCLARRLGEAVDVDVAGRIEAARTSRPGQGGDASAC